MDVSVRLSSTLSGRYEVEREIGAGGMATVYLARDLKHNRKVALKVLHPELSAVLGTERFLKEIELTANLQHPHILPLFDSGEADGLLFYVMPYVEGESLRGRLDRQRQLPVADAIRIASEVAGALDYAHRHGLVHRDVKPENVLFHDGNALVADFGIALAVQSAGRERMTQTGLSLGTPHYMAPEQVMGERGVDGRADVYALGAMVYEMLDGEPPFTGANSPAVLSRVLTERPRDLRINRPQVPEHVEAAVERALEKLPADRWQTAKDFAEALNGSAPLLPLHRGAQRHAGNRPPLQGFRRGPAILAGVATLTILGLSAALALAMLRESPAAPVRFELSFPDSVEFLPVQGPALALSRDGSQLAFVGSDGVNTGLFLRPLDRVEATFIRGTEGGYAPSFSADGDWIFFWSGGGLRKVPAAGGAALSLTNRSSNAESRGDSGEILYGGGNGSIWAVSAEGGASRLVTAPDTLQKHLHYNWPEMLPGGESALITLWKTSTQLENAELGVVNLADGRVTELGIPGCNPRYVDGHVLFGRSDGSVLAAPFSVRRLRSTGPALPLLEGVVVKSGCATDMTFAANGTAVYRTGPGGSPRRLVSVSREGVARDLDTSGVPFLNPRLSRDGRRIAVGIGVSQYGDIWIKDLESTTLSRLTTDEQSRWPEWVPDGDRLAYFSIGGSHPSVQPWDGSGVPEPYVKVPEQLAGAVISAVSSGPPGTFLAVRMRVANNQDIWIAPLGSPDALRPFLTTPATESAPRVSPDGRLLAYVSDETGEAEVYLRPLPGPGGRVQVSTDGGSEPVWSPDGRELFYRTGTHLVSATIARAPALEITSRATLFSDLYQTWGPSGVANYDVFPNGREFIMVRDMEDASRLFVVLNWSEKLGARGAVGASR